MANVDWRITGPELATCNCSVGCPCQFNGLPTYGDCRAAVAMRIDKGHFGETLLDGLKWVGVFAWPGAIHEGKGEALAILDERANERQREALLKILSGQESEPGATYFNVFASTITNFHPPVFKPINFEADVAKRTGRFSVAGIVESRGEPIRNPMTGSEHQVRVTIPHGFEFAEAEFGTSTTKASGTIALDWANRHAHFCTIDIGPKGPYR
jgi:hypothetical protein